MTSLLTNEELWKFWWNKPEVADGEDDSMEAEFVAAARAIEAAVIKRLAAGVSVEPAAERRRIRYTWGECWDYRDDEKVPFTVPFNLVVVTPTAPLFTLDQLTTAIAAARVQENERCARTLEAIGCQGYADALRALLGKEQL